MTLLVRRNHQRLPPPDLHNSNMTQSQETGAAQPVWYETNPTNGHVTPTIRSLLETYSGIPPDEVLDHVVKLRDEAWKVHPYPCIGQFRFLEPSFIGLSKEYDEAVERLRNGKTLLDMACCFGQTIRQLVHGGAPGKNIYGCDLQPDFIDLGYKLFRDREKLQSKFLVADIFDSSSALAEFRGNFDMVYSGSFFHL